MNVTIPRASWLRGEGSTVSSLYRPEDGKSCCLGHVLMACGLTKQQLSDVSSPAALVERQGHGDNIPDGLLRSYNTLIMSNGEGKDSLVNSGLCRDLMVANDHKSTPEAARELQVADALHAIGIEVEFV